MTSSGFVPNHGQLADDVVYEAALAGGVVQVQPLGWQLQLSPPLTSSIEPITLTMELVGASSPAAWESSQPLVTTVSDYRQPDPSRWRSDVPQYQQIQARSIYPQIDLQYTVTPSATLKSSYLVAAGADPSQIAWRYPEALGVEIAHDGSLVIQVNPTTTITESTPIAWQDLGEDRVFVPVAFQLAHDGTVGFAVGAYDPSQPLVLDPSLTITANPSQFDMTEPRVIQSHSNGTWYVAGCSGLQSVVTVYDSSATTVIERMLVGTAYSTGSICTNLALSPTGAIAVATWSRDRPSTPAQVWHWNSPTSTPSVVTLPATASRPAVIGMVIHPSNGQTQVLWQDGQEGITPPISYLSTLDQGSLLTNTALAGNGRIYTQLAQSPNGMLYRGYRETPLGSGIQSAGIERWTGSNWVSVWGQSGTTTSGWTVGPLVIDAQEQVIASVIKQDTAPLVNSHYEQLWYVRVPAAGAVVQQPLSQEYHQPNGFTYTYPRSMVALANGQVAIGGVSQGYGYPLATLSAEWTSGFVLTVDSAGQIVDQLALREDDHADTVVSGLGMNQAGMLLVGGHETWQATSPNSNQSFLATVADITIQTKPQPPAYSVSYYVQSKSIKGALQSGCDARRGGDRMVVLAFGRPSRQDGDPTTRVMLLVQQNDQAESLYISYDQIYEWALAFAVGYATPYATWQGEQCTGLPAQYNPATLDSPLLPKAELTLVLGSSNAARYDGITYQDNPYLTGDDGIAWGELINDVEEDLRNPLNLGSITTKIFPRVKIAAGFDAEYYQHPWGDDRSHRVPINGEKHGSWEWSTYAWTVAWLLSYDQYQRQSAQSNHIYIFGSCESCPRAWSPDTWGTDIKTVFGRVIYVNWKLYSAYPMPQLYQAPYIFEWVNVVRYARNQNIGMHIGQLMTDCANTANCQLPRGGGARLTPFDCFVQGSDALCPNGDWQPYSLLIDSDPLTPAYKEFPPHHGWQAFTDQMTATRSETTPPKHVTDICGQVSDPSCGSR
ncbi:hypothetical protein [Herpetosiphon gulosus]|uniref:DUF7948 domain-containing protein n=1 Tax=Herpetosiphon gulosus TaxID=1973496 RepID=A0ABP9WTA9_9CHLR